MSASSDEKKHITEQAWLPELREDGIYLIGADDRTVILKMCRPDRGSDLFIAGYISGLQVRKQREEGGQVVSDENSDEKKSLEQLLSEFAESLRPDQLRVLATRMSPDQKKALRSLLSPDQRSVVDEAEADEARTLADDQKAEAQ